MSKTETESKPKRRWCQYSLRSFPVAKSGFPAVLRAGSGCSSDADSFPDIVPQYLRKRRVTIEQWI